jgi:hypothetical protein
MAFFSGFLRMKYDHCFQLDLIIALYFFRLSNHRYFAITAKCFILAIIATIALIMADNNAISSQ